MSQKSMFFAAALMLSAATAKRDISTALTAEAEEANRASPLFEHHKKEISPERRFNLEAMIQASIGDDIKEDEGPHMEEHKHGEDHHIVDDGEKTETNHFGILDEGHHRLDSEYRRHEHDGEWREPKNYYFEYPHRPERHLDYQEEHHYSPEVPEYHEPHIEEVLQEHRHFEPEHAVKMPMDFQKDDHHYPEEHEEDFHVDHHHEVTQEDQDPFIDPATHEEDFHLTEEHHLHDLDHHLKDHHRTEEETQELAEELSKELARRHLGHRYIRTPAVIKASVTGIQDAKSHGLGQGQVVDIVYDDLSRDHIVYNQDQDKLVSESVTFIPPTSEEEDDGVLRSFIDRYTALMTHEQAYMEELPPPQFMHQSLLLHPIFRDLNHGGIHHQHHDVAHQEHEVDEEWPTEFHQVRRHMPAHEHQHEEEYYHHEHQQQPELHELLRRTATDMPHHHQYQHYGYDDQERTSAAGYHHYGYDNQSAGSAQISNGAQRLQDQIIKEGARHLVDQFGMHLTQDHHPEPKMHHSEQVYHDSDVVPEQQRHRDDIEQNLGGYIEAERHQDQHQFHGSQQQFTSATGGHHSNPHSTRSHMVNDTTFWQDHEKQGQHPHTEHEEVDTNDYEYQYYYDDDEDDKLHSNAEYEYYDEQYVAPEEEQAAAQKQPVPGAEYPVVTYSTFRKPKTAKPGQPAIVPHGSYPRDPLHFGHKHSQSQQKGWQSLKQPESGGYTATKMEQPVVTQTQPQPQRSTKSTSQPQPSIQTSFPSQSQPRTTTASQPRTATAPQPQITTTRQVQQAPSPTTTKATQMPMQQQQQQPPIIFMPVPTTAYVQATPPTYSPIPVATPAPPSSTKTQQTQSQPMQQQSAPKTVASPQQAPQQSQPQQKPQQQPVQQTSPKPEGESSRGSQQQSQMQQDQQYRITDSYGQEVPASLSPLINFETPVVHPFTQPTGVMNPYAAPAPTPPAFGYGGVMPAQVTTPYMAPSPYGAMPVVPQMTPAYPSMRTSVAPQAPLGAKTQGYAGLSVPVTIDAGYSDQKTKKKEQKARDLQQRTYGPTTPAGRDDFFSQTADQFPTMGASQVGGYPTQMMMPPAMMAPMPMGMAGPMAVQPLPGKKGKMKKPKMSPYEKMVLKQQKAAQAQKQKDRQAGVMSFDSFYGEAGQFNEVKENGDDYYYDYDVDEDTGYDYRDDDAQYHSSTHQHYADEDDAYSPSQYYYPHQYEQAYHYPSSYYYDDQTLYDDYEEPRHHHGYRHGHAHGDYRAPTEVIDKVKPIWYNDYDDWTAGDSRTSVPTLHHEDVLAHQDGGSIDIHISEPFHQSMQELETYVPIVADYFDKDLHYDATHYLYEPEDMSELLNHPKPDDTPEEHDPQIHHLSPIITEQDDSGDEKEIIESIIERVEESVQHDLVPLLHQDGPHEHEDPEIIATLTEALIEGIVKGEAEAVKKVQKEIIDKESNPHEQVVKEAKKEFEESPVVVTEKTEETPKAVIEDAPKEVVEDAPKITADEEHHDVVADKKEEKAEEPVKKQEEKPIAVTSDDDHHLDDDKEFEKAFFTKAEDLDKQPEAEKPAPIVDVEQHKKEIYTEEPVAHGDEEVIKHDAEPVDVQHKQEDTTKEEPVAQEHEAIIVHHAGETPSHAEPTVVKPDSDVDAPKSESSTTAPSIDSKFAVESVEDDKQLHKATEGQKAEVDGDHSTEDVAENDFDEQEFMNQVIQLLI